MAKETETPMGQTAEKQGVQTEEKPMSAKERYNSRIMQDYKGSNPEDEEAWYKAANERYDDYTSIRNGLGELNSMIDNNAMFREMMVAASEGGADWNPVAWLRDNKALDLKALAEDPEYADKFAEAQKKHLESVAKGDEMKKAASENYAASSKAIDEYCKANGISEEQKADTWEKIENLLNDANVGKVSVDTFALLCKGGSYDNDMEAARSEGVQEGLGKNVSDKLRKMPMPERNSGRQMAEEQPKPTQRNNNPFMA